MERNDQKYKELIKYISARSINDPRFGRTKLNKILFFCDFLAYRDLGAPISGDTYHKEQYGPVPTHIRKMMQELIDQHEMAESAGVLGGYIQKKPVTLKDADLSLFSVYEISLIDNVIDRLSESTAYDVSELSHEFVGWQICEMGEKIPYETVLIEHRELNDDDIEYAKTLIPLAKQSLAS